MVDIVNKIHVLGVNVKMARKDTRYDREASDEAYNARRRFVRKAERYWNMAQGATGVTRERYEAIARKSLSDAMSTYEKGTSQKSMSKKIRELDKELKPVDVFRREAKQSISKRLKERSERSLYSRDEQVRREQEAKSIMSSEAGHRIYAGTIDVWQDSDYLSREDALMAHFGVDTLMDVIELFEEELGEDLYAEEKVQVKYDEIVGLIAKKTSKYGA